jgi:hypothetical protein
MVTLLPWLTLGEPDQLSPPIASAPVEWRPGKDPIPIINAAIARGTNLAAEEVLGRSRRQVPHEEGTLERSGRAGVIDGRGRVRGAVSYDTPYAVEQHERTDYRHKKGRKANYLEDPLNADGPRLLRELVGTELRNALK